MTARKVMLVCESCIREIEIESMRKKKDKCSTKYLIHDLQRVLWDLVTKFVNIVA